MPSPNSPTVQLDRAFPAHPRADRYYPAASTEAARHRIAQCALRGDGAALLIGTPGVGKSMLLEVLAADLRGQLDVVRLASTQLCTRRALLQAILHGLDGPYQNREEGELRLALSDLLSQASRPIALLIDEAQTLPVRLLEELRLLTNLAVKGSPRVRLVLAGTNALDEAFTAPELESFNQRLAARCYLEPLRREETAQYVRAQVAAAGGDPDRVIAADAYDAVALASDGLPRLINQVCDRALVLGAERGSTQLDSAAIGEAWSDLHQLAAPWQTPKSSPLAAAEPAAEIEFGLLDDENEALQAEAEAVTALAEEIGVDRAVWDAGDRLHDLPSETASDQQIAADVVEPDEEELVSYAFPTVSDGETAEYGLAELDDEPVIVEEATPSDETPDTTAVTSSQGANPFAEDFDEEEVVLDPYAELERVIPAAVMVAPQEPNHLSQAFDTLLGQPEAGFSLDRPVEAGIEVTSAPEEVFQAAASAPINEDDILVVEADDSPAIEAGARRLEYAELFANLRQG